MLKITNSSDLSCIAGPLTAVLNSSGTFACNDVGTSATRAEHYLVPSSCRIDERTRLIVVCVAVRVRTYRLRSLGVVIGLALIGRIVPPGAAIVGLAVLDACAVAGIKCRSYNIAIRIRINAVSRRERWANLQVPWTPACDLALSRLSVERQWRAARCTQELLVVRVRVEILRRKITN